MILLLILNGLIWISGLKFVHLYALFILSLMLFYIIFFKLRSSLKRLVFINKIQIKTEKKGWIYILTGVIALFIFMHLIELSGSPLLKAFNSLDYYGIVDLRKSITRDHAFYWNYGLNFSLKAIIPFLILYFHIKGPRWFFYLFIIFSAFYALSLIQKSFIVTIFLPLIVYTLYKRKWKTVLLSAFIIFSGIVSIYFATNPVLRGGKPAKSIVIAEKKGERSQYRIVVISKAIAKRLTIIPGEMVSEWFEHIPSKKPYLYGQGYRFIAPFIGKDYVSYSLELYPIMKPKYAEKGIKGSVNAASFMYEYANFGWVGLILSGFLLAFIFNFVELIFFEHTILKICLNIFPMLMLSSTSLFTLLLTGGWMINILLFICFSAFFIKEKSIG